MSENFIDWTRAYHIKPSPLIHVGAHLAQERYVYRELGFEPVLWFEAQPEIAEKADENLKAFKFQNVRNAGLWSKAGVELELFIAGNEGSSSSLLEPFLISASHPDVSCIASFFIKTSTLDAEITQSQVKYKVLVLDVQGAELEVLKGGVRTLQDVGYIFSEISTLELYRNNPLANQIEHYLEENGFVFAASSLNRNTGWGEGLFIRKEICESIPNFEFSHTTVGNLISKGRIFRTLLIYCKALKTQFLKSGNIQK